MQQIIVRACAASALLLSSCGDVQVDDRLGAPTPDIRPTQTGSDRCLQTHVALPLLGLPGDSPILPVQEDGQTLAMFFSPGFVPLLFRNNGQVSFPRFRKVDLRQQDGDESPAYASTARNLTLGPLTPADQRGYLLPEPDDHSVDGRPIIGMLGRDILPAGTVVALDMPGRRVGLSYPQDGCLKQPRPALEGSVEMQQDVLLVPVQINGHPMQAVLEPDLPVSILPRKLANRIGISDVDLANDPSVVTRFGKGVLGRRHHVDTLVVGDVRLQHFTFDVEDDVRYAMLGLNFFGLGQGVFDFANQKFLFTQTVDTLPAPSSLHFDRTRVAHTSVEE